MINDDFNLGIAPESEVNSTKKLYQYEILDSAAEQDFDTIITMAATLFGTQNAHISFINEEQVFLKAILDKNEADDVLQVNQLLVANCIEKEVILDQENAQLPEKIQFYAAVPIVSPEGEPLGSLAVSDTKPHQPVTAKLLEMLHMLSKLVTEKLEKRLSQLEIVRSCNERLRTVAHDIKNPVTSISLYVQLLGSKEMETEKVFSMASKIATSLKRIEENLNNLPKKTSLSPH